MRLSRPVESVAYGDPPAVHGPLPCDVSITGEIRQCGSVNSSKVGTAPAALLPPHLRCRSGANAAGINSYTGQPNIKLAIVSPFASVAACKGCALKTTASARVSFRFVSNPIACQCPFHQFGSIRAWM